MKLDLENINNFDIVEYSFNQSSPNTFRDLTNK